MAPLYLSAFILCLLSWTVHCTDSSSRDSGCPELNPPFYGALTYNGSLVTSNNQPKWLENDTVTFVCERGFVLYNTLDQQLGNEWSVSCEAKEGPIESGSGSGSGKSNNSNGNETERYISWSPTPQQLRCSRVDCGTPYTVANGSVSYNTTALFSAAKYTCDAGYQITGEAEYSVCWWDGMWRPENITCTAIPPITLCTDPPTIANGDRTWTTDNTAPVGTTVEYRCDSGYTLDRATLAVCDTTGQWTPPPTCTASAVLSSTEIFIIEGAGGVFLILLLSTALMFVSCLLCRNRIKQRRYIEDEETLANSGAFTLSNPLVSVKDEDAAGNPLYLTPDEMNEFEQQQ